MPLGVEVWNWENEVWSRVITYSNMNGSFGWTKEHLDISLYAMNKLFKIRFLAYGNYSPDIQGWFIDNIDVYRKCDIPYTLGASVNYNTASIILNWVDPGGGEIAEWIHWDDGVNFGSF